MQRAKGKGFTLTELLVVIGISVVLTAIAIPTFFSFQKEADLNNGAQEIINILRLAQNKTLASEGASQWGVYFATSTSPHQYTLFKGSDYDSRDISFDRIYQLAKSVEVYEINLWGGNEVVFERVTGYASSTSQLGQVALRLKADLTKTRTIYIESFGRVGLE